MAGDRDLKDLIYYLKVHCLWYNFDGKFKSLFISFQYVRLVYLCGLSPLVVASMHFIGLRDSLSKYAFFASGGFYVQIKAVSYYLNRKNTEIIVGRLIRLHSKRTLPWQHAIFYKYSKPIWKFLSLHGNIAFYYIIFYFILPLIYDTFLYATSELTAPFNFPFPLEGLTNKERSPMYYMLLLASLIWASLVLSFALGSLAVLWVAVSYCCVDIKILCRLVEDFGNDVSDAKMFGSLIDDMRDILELSRDMKIVIGPPMGAQNAVGSLLLTFFLYSATMQMGKDNVLLGMCLFALAAMTIVMFVCCFIGEALQAESNKLFNAFCELPWYLMKPEMRKSLSFIILVTSRPMVIDYKGKLALNLQTFMQMINSSYSYFMLLNSMN